MLCVMQLGWSRGQANLFCKYMSELVSTMQDQGTEHHIGMLSTVKTSNVIPNFSEPSAEQLAWVHSRLCGMEDAGEAAAAPAAQPPPGRHIAGSTAPPLAARGERCDARRCSS